MERFALGHATGRDAKAVARDCAAQLSTCPSGANIGFLYLTDDFTPEAERVLGILRETTGVESWVGTGGHGILASGHEYYGEPAIVAMVGAVPPDSFRLFKARAREDANLDRAWLTRSDAHFGIVHANPRAPGLESALPKLVNDTNGFFVGGLTSSQTGQPQIAGSIAHEAAISGVLFSEDVPVVSGLTQGCTPLGTPHRITEAQDNIAITLDGRPALDVMKEDIGELLARDLRRLGGYIHVALPVPGSDRADYMVRNLTGIDPQRGLIGVGDHLEVGRTLMFCRRDANSAREDLKRMVSEVKTRARGTPRGAVYYSCVARGPHMFGPASAEMAAIREGLGDVPTVGFFCNGEISHDRLYGYTGVLSLFL